MKQATTNKLGIYSTYSPRSSINFLVRCFNFYKPLKNNSEGCPSNQVSAAAMTSASDEKWRTFNCFFQSREHVVVRRGQILRIWWVIKTLEAQVDQFLLGCKCPVSRGIVVQEQDPLGDLTAAFHPDWGFPWFSSVVRQMSGYSIQSRGTARNSPSPPGALASPKHLITSHAT